MLYLSFWQSTSLLPNAVILNKCDEDVQYIMEAKPTKQTLGKPYIKEIEVRE